MFFVFGPSGQMYRGGPDNLAQITPVRRVQRPKALHSGAMSADAPSSPAAPPAALPGPRPHLRKEAVSAYVQTEQGPAQQRQPLTRVKDVMTVGALSVPPDARLSDAWQTLAQQGVAQAPVVNDQGQAVGLLLRADMAPLNLLPEPRTIRQAIELARRPVSEVMVSPVPTVAADTELRRVAKVLLDTGLPGLPVTDERGLLTGFISRTDILRAVAADPPLDLWS
ncbi:CBS domain-containing protein [Diaphorobacter sp.]|uniref:CBS domain-containing protein n=1 Tax=Diaphorobacter sp. TaxID=1934310 RepID=UPI003D09B369